MATFSDKPTITGGRVLLRPICADDAQHMWEDVHDEESNRLTGTRDEFTFDQIERWCATRLDQDDRLDLAVVERANGGWGGEIVINEWDAANRSCGFRIALAAQARDRGLGTEATRLVVDHVFGEIRDPTVNRIELEVYAFNERAAAMYDKVGFVREGIRREALWWDGRFHDAIVMSILRSDVARSGA